jgi:hypothetical protein
VSSDAPESCSSCSTSDTCRVTRKRHEHHLTLKSCWAPTYINKFKYHLLNINSRQNKWEKRWTTVHYEIGLFSCSRHNIYISVFDLFNSSRHNIYISVFDLFNSSRHNIYISVFDLFNGSEHQIRIEGSSGSWSYSYWIYNYLCKQFISPLTLWVRI